MLLLKEATRSKRKRKSSETARLQVVITALRAITHTIELGDMYSYEQFQKLRSFFFGCLGIVCALGGLDKSD